MVSLYSRHRGFGLAGGLLLPILVALVSWLPAQVEPDNSGLGQAQFRHPSLTIPSSTGLISTLSPQASSQAAADLASLGAGNGARLDRLGGSWANLTLSQPLLPGRGSGNGLSWNDLGVESPASRAGLGKAGKQAFLDFVLANASALRLDPAQLSGKGKATVLKNGELIQIHLPRQYQGIPVLENYLSGVINSGNLVLLGTNKWGPIDLSPTPTLSLSSALGVLLEHVGDDHSIQGSWGKHGLIIVPTAASLPGPGLNQPPFGLGYRYRLVWRIRPSFAGDHRSFEALVDAHTGELLAFEDRNRYGTSRRVKGGVYPRSNDGVAPLGTEQAGWPMPFAFVDSNTGTHITDSGGNVLACVDGDISTDLSGPFMQMNDTCGVVTDAFAADVDLSTSAGTDCTVPAGFSAGNTHASRTGFYELNRIAEMARSHLPGNTWLQQQLVANMNLNADCNAFWDFTTVNFYTSGGGCSNTGELAGIFDHEWGHGLDDNDANPTISTPGEGIADIYMALRLNTSCIGDNFRPGVQCGGYGDPCTNCTGVRDIDWNNRAAQTPKNIAWINANCPLGNTPGPCGGAVHCESALEAESVWDLIKRDLPTFYSMDSNTAAEVGAYLTYAGAGNVGDWFSCDTTAPEFGGCNAFSGYKQYLTADDDNGDLTDGTPHMQAIYSAFNRHGIACDDLTVQDSGCAGTPVSAPAVTGTSIDRGAKLTWNAVAGATSYQIFRSDGISGVTSCSGGKIKAGETTGLIFYDEGLQNGRSYDYVVIPKGPSDSCFGPASTCTTVVPALAANLAIDTTSGVIDIQTGDGDAFVDNCELASLTFDIDNIGNQALTNVRISDVRVPSHPDVFIKQATVVTSSLDSSCTSTKARVDFVASGLTHLDDLVFEIDATSDELDPTIRTARFVIDSTESDILSTQASHTWNFAADRDGWQEVQGTFVHVGTPGEGGANGFLSTSADDQVCDQIRSPLVILTSTSTLTLSTNFDLEASFFSNSPIECAILFGLPAPCTVWFDRANASIRNVSSGLGSIITPDGGRLYNAFGASGGAYCTNNQTGWAGSMPSWAQSTFTSGALGAAALAGDIVQVDLKLGTDELESPGSFGLDTVTLTDFSFVGPDTQSDSCPTCSETFNLTSGEWTQISLSCCPRYDENTVADVLGDDLSGAWAIFKRAYGPLPANDQYVSVGSADRLHVGEGYWIRSNETSPSFTVEGLANQPVEFRLQEDAAGRSNMAGNPFEFDVCWADVEILDGATVQSLTTAADVNGILSRTAHKWTGASYAVFDGTTPGLKGTLEPFDGLWVKAFEGATDVRLRIPAISSLDCEAAPAALAGAAISLRKGDKNAVDWFVRLIAESGDRLDRHNVLGQLAASQDGPDSHDLGEPPPFGTPYLSIVFPHPEWGGEFDDYTSDFHAHQKKDQWYFEVLGSEIGAQVTLRWEAGKDLLKTMVLLDPTTGKRIKPKQDGSYTFTQQQTRQGFWWLLGKGQPD